MLAAVFKGDGKLELEQRPVPAVERDEDVIIRVGAVGICGTDVHALDVPPKRALRVGVIMGHEVAGEVVAVGAAAKEFQPGDRVVIDPNPPCGKCKMCRSGFPNACSKLFTNSLAPGWSVSPGFFWDGAFAEFTRFPLHHLHRIRPELPYWQAAVIEPVACVLNGMNKLNVRPGESAVVLGAGPIGLLFVSLLKASGASTIIVSEPAKVRRDAAAACGATVLVDPTKEDVRERVLAETNADGADVAIDAVGSLLALAIDVLRMGGRVNLFGLDMTAKVEIPAARITKNELQIFGTYMTKYTFPAAVKLVEAGAVPLGAIVTHRLALSRIHEGILLQRKGEAIKVVLSPDGSLERG